MEYASHDWRCFGLYFYILSSATSRWPFKKEKKKRKKKKKKEKKLLSSSLSVLGSLPYPRDVA